MQEKADEEEDEEEQKQREEARLRREQPKRLRTEPLNVIVVLSYKAHRGPVTVSRSTGESNEPGGTHRPRQCCSMGSVAAERGGNQQRPEPAQWRRAAGR